MSARKPPSRTAPGLWAEGARLNLERALRVGDELGGHIVTGHVDAVATVTKVEEVGGSLDVTIEAPRALGGAIAPKGSIALDGVSLTVNRSRMRAKRPASPSTSSPTPPITPRWAESPPAGSSTSRSTCWRAI